MNQLTAMSNVNNIAAQHAKSAGARIQRNDQRYDIDMVKINGLPVDMLPNLVYGICDLSGAWPYHEPDDMGCCIISSPILMFINNNLKDTSRSG